MINKLKQQPLKQNLFNKDVVQSKTGFFKTHVLKIHDKSGFLVYKWLPQKRHQHLFKNDYFIYILIPQQLPKKVFESGC